MTTITIESDEKGGTYTFEGHAGDKSVCAGISALFYTALGYAENNNRSIKYDYAEYPRKGAGYISFTAKGSKRKANALMDFLEIGLRQIEAGYPAHCQVIYK